MIVFHLSVRLYALPEKMCSAWQGVKYTRYWLNILITGFKVNSFGIRTLRSKKVLL